ncbi:MAG: cytidine deaminase [Defluviitaleaceae bacterium]|nr:cytidine deaminase [Defluviitaleaceae bacterium]
MDYKELAQVAIDAKKAAYVPYSKFRVGAALFGKSGKIYMGCNIESAAYSPTCCAERTALVKAVSEGEREFTAIAVAGSAEGGEVQYCYPCGVCRQFLKEFVSDDMPVIIAKTADDYRVHKFEELLPHSFGPEDLK